MHSAMRLNCFTVDPLTHFLARLDPCFAFFKIIIDKCSGNCVLGPSRSPVSGVTLALSASRSRAIPLQRQQLPELGA